MSIIDTLQTGDVLLCNCEKKKGLFGLFTKIIKWGSHSNWTHIAMVLKNPTYINSNLKGIYVWESSEEKNPDPQDDKKKIGVQITPLQEFLDSYKDSGTIIVRKLHSQLITPEKIKQIHKVVYDKPYDIDIVDWFEALIKKDFTKLQKTNRFWCSALVAYIYTKCGILDKNTDWSIIAPNDFDLSVTNILKWTKGNYLEPNELRIL